MLLVSIHVCGLLSQPACIVMTSINKQQISLDYFRELYSQEKEQERRLEELIKNLTATLEEKKKAIFLCENAIQFLSKGRVSPDGKQDDSTSCQESEISLAINILEGADNVLQPKEDSFDQKEFESFNREDLVTGSSTIHGGKELAQGERVRQVDAQPVPFLGKEQHHTGSASNKCLTRQPEDIASASDFCDGSALNTIDGDEMKRLPQQMLLPKFQGMRQTEVIKQVLTEENRPLNGRNIAKIAYEWITQDEFKRIADSVRSALKNGAGRYWYQLPDWGEGYVSFEYASKHLSEAAKNPTSERIREVALSVQNSKAQTVNGHR